MSAAAFEKRTTAYAEAALDRECAEVAATSGGRNNRLNQAAFALGQFVGGGTLDRSVVERRLIETAEANGYIAKDGLAAARTAIRSGINAGMHKPRNMPSGQNHEPRKFRSGAADSQERAEEPLPAWTPLGEDGRPRFVAIGQDEPPHIADEIPGRRHLYRRDGVVVRAKIKRQAGGFLDFYRVRRPDTGDVGWQAKKPSDYVVTPYAGVIDPFAAERPSSTIFCPEGEKDVDTLGRYGLPAFAFGGSGDVPDGYEQFVRNRDVVVLADNDEPGRRWAEKISTGFAAVASRVRVVHFPELPEGNDVSDWFERFGGSVEALLERIEKQPAIAAAASEGPLPLFPPPPPAQPYPLDALGPLAAAARAIASQVQAPEAIAGQSVLSVAALAAQAIADVILPIGLAGQARPLSLYLITVAASGDRKTSADNEALRPVRMREKALRDIYHRDHEMWRIAHAAWKSQCRSIEGKKGLDLEERRIELGALGTEPAEPVRPILTAPDPTVEGLAKLWPTLPGSLGLFTSEGGQMTGGYGFGPDHRLKTAAALSMLWDGGGIRRMRSLDGLTDLRGRRLALHLMVQPDVAADFLSDPVLRDQGLLSRVLLAAPNSNAGARLYRDPRPEDDVAIRRYIGTILRLLEVAWPCEADRSNELSPRPLPLSSEARHMWIEFHDRVEVETRPDGSLAELKDVAGKAAEQAARVAGVLAVVEDPTAKEIPALSMSGALELVTWHLNEALRVSGSARMSTKLRDAQSLLDWMVRNGKQTITVREVQQFGPGRLRGKDIIIGTVGVLLDHGWLVVDPIQRNRWTVIPGRRP